MIRAIAQLRRGRCLVALCYVLLAGCVLPGGGGSPEDDAEEPAPIVTEGGVVLAGPPGFCVVEDTHVWQDTAEFAALLPCGGILALPVPQAILTLAVGGQGTAAGLDLTGKALAAYFTGPEGRAAISRAGQAETVRIHEVRETSGAVVVRLTDASGQFPGLSWRAVADIRGHLVTLTVRSNGQNPLVETVGRGLINRFVASMRRANAG